MNVIRLMRPEELPSFLLGGRLSVNKLRKLNEKRDVERVGWDPGPWDREPDHVQYVDDATGYDCLAVRQPSSGHWCGYVGVPAGHPLFGRNYNDSVPDLAAALERRMHQPIGEAPSFSVLISALAGKLEPTPDSVLTVHGGITFAARCQEGGRICHVPEPGRPEVWWFGFDCKHSGDSAPGDAPMWRRLGRPDFIDRDGTYRTLAYVEDEIANLAAQLHAINMEVAHA